MPSEVTPEEFQHLATRTGILEREVEGEKLVTRHIFEQTRRNGADLAAMRGDMATMNTRLGRIEHKLEGVDLHALARKVDGLDRKFDALTKNLPHIVGDAVRDANRARDRKR
jgi:hypothetical protein